MRLCHAHAGELVAGRVLLDGAEGGSRTHNLLFTKQLLCH